MSQAVQAPKERTQSGPLVITRTDEGFRVYSPQAPDRVYLVNGPPEDPNCTCPEFQDQPDPNWRCEHMRAVFGHEKPEGNAPKGQPAGETPPRKTRAAKAAENGNHDRAQMLLKRSVSPDGRIDSLSVEFSCPVGGSTAKDIKAKALRTMELQTDIVGSFLSANGKEKPQPSNGNGSHGNGNHGNGAIQAQMLNIGWMNTKWGRRLYITIQANGDTLKLFGNRKRLAEVLVSAGYPDKAESINEGIQINVPCLVTTKSSDNGKYTNIDEVFPAEKPTASRGGR